MIGVSGKTIAVVGDACDSAYNTEALLKKWDQGNYYVLGGSGRSMNPNATVSILTGIRTRAGLMQPPAIVRFIAGSDDRMDLGGMNGADVVVTCGGATSSEANDRPNLELDQEGDMTRVAAAAMSMNIPVVALLSPPGTILTSAFSGTCAGIINMFLAGQATGDAWADVLFGVVNPTGRLPVTYPTSIADTVEPCPDVQCDYTEGLRVGYRNLEGVAVNFPFGHGLSYTSFEYTLVGQVDGGSQGCPDTAVVCVSIQVKNTGAVDGADVPQLYVTFPASPLASPRGLRGFEKTPVLAPASTTTVQFQLGTRDFSSWCAEAGDFAPGRLLLHLLRNARHACVCVCVCVCV